MLSNQVTSQNLKMGIIAICPQSIIVLMIGLTSIVNGQMEGQAAPTVVDIITKRGFHVETYAIGPREEPLAMYRIINPLANPATLNRYPVLYGHGVLFDALSMVSRSENSRPRRPVLGQPTIKHGNAMDPTDDYALPFAMSNNNFDVWMFDSKGTNELNRNMSAISKDIVGKYWDFSLDEQSLVYLPLFIDFVLERTASKKLAYVGFSQSTFFLFALLSQKPEYADKIVAAAAMAPVTYVAHTRGLTLPILAPIAMLTPNFIQSSFVPPAVINAIDTVIGFLCIKQGFRHAVCGSLTSGIGGFGSNEHAPTFYDSFYKLTSIKTIKHFLQLVISRRFGMYDYGPLENMKRYGQPNAPNYDLSKIRSDRIIVLRGLSDFLANPEDQMLLISQMGIKPYADIVLNNYNHFDFIDGHDLIKKVNEPIMLKFYELMYKEGPNILRTPEQYAAILRAARPPTSTSFARPVSQIPHPSAQPNSATLGPSGALDMAAHSIGLLPGITDAGNILSRLLTAGRR